MKTQQIIIIALQAAFLLFCYVKYGQLRSVSASVHSLKGPIEVSLYSWFILITSFYFIISLDCTGGVIAGFSLMIDAAAVSVSKKENKLQYYLHNFGAMIGIGAGMVTFIWLGYAWYVIPYGVSLILIYGYPKVKNDTYWAEIAALITAHIVIGQI